MNTLQQSPPWPTHDGQGQINKENNMPPIRWRISQIIHWCASVMSIAKIDVLPLLGIILVNLLTLFLFAGTILQLLDPAAGILDIGILSVLLLGIVAGLLAIFCSIWLQELLWQPFKVFRKQFNSHFNQLSSWQQCILYFSAFFLLLYAVLWGLAIVF